MRSTSRQYMHVNMHKLHANTTILMFCPQVSTPICMSRTELLLEPSGSAICTVHA